MAYSNWQIRTWMPTPDSDSCTMQKFHTGSDSVSDPLIEMYVVGTEICPYKGYSNHLGNYLSRDPDPDLNQCEKFWIILCSHRVWCLNLSPSPSPSPDPAMWISHNIKWITSVVHFIPPLLLSWWSGGHFLLSILWHAPLLLHIPVNTNNDIKILCVWIKVHLHAPSPSPSKFIVVPMVTDLLTDRLGSQYIMNVNVNLTVTVTRDVVCKQALTRGSLRGFPVCAADAVNWCPPPPINVWVQKSHSGDSPSTQRMQ